MNMGLRVDSFENKVDVVIRHIDNLRILSDHRLSIYYSVLWMESNDVYENWYNIFSCRIEVDVTKSDLRRSKTLVGGNIISWLGRVLRKKIDISS